MYNNNDSNNKKMEAVPLFNHSNSPSFSQQTPLVSYSSANPSPFMAYNTRNASIDQGLQSKPNSNKDINNNPQLNGYLNKETHGTIIDKLLNSQAQSDLIIAGNNKNTFNNHPSFSSAINKDGQH